MHSEAPGGPGRRITWTAYAYLSAFGFSLYAVGALTPFLGDALALSDAQAALHPSAAAAGMIAAGSLTDALERRVGRRRTLAVAVGLMVAAAVALGSAVALPVTLVGAFGLGLGGGAMFSAINETLGRPGGIGSEARFARANTWSMLASLVAPVAIAALASSAVGWHVVPLLPLAVPVVLELTGGLSAGAGRHSPAATAGHLPPDFWTAWAFVLVAVSIEFSYVVWGSSMVVARTGVSLEAATALAAMFLTGMLAGRVALGAGWVGTARFGRWVELALLLTALGGIAVWLAPDTATTAAGLLLAGFGTATLYPLGMAVALGRAGEATVTAGARMVLASGLAILAAPLVLGAVSDAFGVVAGWPLVVALCAVALVIHRSSRGTGIPVPA